MNIPEHLSFCRVMKYIFRINCQNLECWVKRSIIYKVSGILSDSLAGVLFLLPSAMYKHACFLWALTTEYVRVGRIVANWKVRNSITIVLNLHFSFFLWLKLYIFYRFKSYLFYVGSWPCQLFCWVIGFFSSLFQGVFFMYYVLKRLTFCDMYANLFFPVFLQFWFYLRHFLQTKCFLIVM